MARTADIISYLPPVLQDIYEINLITSSQNNELNLLWQTAEEILNNSFIKTVTESGISHWEKLLSIKPQGETLEERRFAVLTALTRRLPFTKNVLMNQLNSICGTGNFEVRLDDYKFTIYLALTASSSLNAVYEMLKNMLPANLLIEVLLLYRKYQTLNSVTHSVLSNITHGYIKEGGELI